MNFFWRFLLGLLAVTGAVAIAGGAFGIEFGRSNYWDHHGLLFLAGITCFPRITLLFFTAPIGGFLWGLSWLFAPRMLVAVLATLAYWQQNPFLVVFAWLVALGGESSEKAAIVHQSQTYWGRRKGFNEAKWVESETRERR